MWELKLNATNEINEMQCDAMLMQKEKHTKQKGDKSRGVTPWWVMDAKRKGKGRQHKNRAVAAQGRR